MILLVGAGGYLGSILTKSFIESGHNVITVSNTFQWEKLPSESRYHCTAGMFDFYSHEIKNVTTIIYMAGSTDILNAELNPANDLISHMSQLRSFLESLSGVKNTSLRKVFFFSSAGTIYGESQGSSSAKSEDSVMAPLSIYGKRNMLLEDIFCQYADKLDIQHCSVRISNPFGITQQNFRRKGLIHALLSSSLNGNCVYLRGDGLQKRDYLYSSDFCKIIIELSSLVVLPRYINVCSGISLTALDIVSMMNQIGLYPNISLVSDQPHYEIRESYLSNALMLKLLGERVFPLLPMQDALLLLQNG